MAAQQGNRPASRQVYYVKDNGLGISEAYQHRVFMAFNRLHPDVSRGEGVGLALVKRMVERQEGSMWLESAVGVGSTFFVALRARSEDDSKVMRRPATHVSITASGEQGNEARTHLDRTG